jgi:hypothetical protein
MTWTCWAGPLVIALATTSCGIRTGIEDCQRTREVIQQELGVDSDCRFSSFNGPMGSKYTVTVGLRPAPSGEAAAIKGKVTEIVKRNFRSPVDQVSVVF